MYLYVQQSTLEGPYDLPASLFQSLKDCSLPLEVTDSACHGA